jgi:hypothetical protein
MAKKTTANPTTPSARAPRSRSKATAAATVPVDVLGTTASDPLTQAADKALPAKTEMRETPIATDPAPVPTYDDIARAAYQRYLSRGGDHGRDFDDWLEAEQALRSKK